MPATVTLTFGSNITAVDVQIVLTAPRRTYVLIDDVSISNVAALPVELTRFDAAATVQGVAVSWATASEQGNDRFEVQRSADGEAFEIIGTVKGQGTSSRAHAYSFLDARPLPGRAYYRLRQVDTDGTSRYSPVASAEWNGRGLAGAYPNPTTGTVWLPATVGAVRYRVLNNIGQLLLSGSAAGQERLDLSALPKGTFFLELTGPAGRTTQRLVRE
ncbi:MAG TPA: T9SS type A sorting domain-containing protein [Hymenobacter sp.]